MRELVYTHRQMFFLLFILSHSLSLAADLKPIAELQREGLERMLRIHDAELKGPCTVSSRAKLMKLGKRESPKDVISGLIHLENDRDDFRAPVGGITLTAIQSISRVTVPLMARSAFYIAEANSDQMSKKPIQDFMAILGRLPMNAVQLFRGYFFSTYGGFEFLAIYDLEFKEIALFQAGYCE